MMVYKGIYVHPVCNLSFRVYGGHNLVCSVVANFLHGRPLLLAKCGCRLRS